MQAIKELGVLSSAWRSEVPSIRISCMNQPWTRKTNELISGFKIISQARDLYPHIFFQA